jgi:hypothetical protein
MGGMLAERDRKVKPCRGARCPGYGPRVVKVIADVGVEDNRRGREVISQ